VVGIESLKGKNIGYLAHPKNFLDERAVLVMIHGAGGAAENWLLQLGPLERYANALALELPGHGKTPGKGYSTVEEYANWVIQVLSSTFTDNEELILMGHSMGGAIVQEVALREPELLKGIVLVCTGARLKVAPFILQGLEKEFAKTINLIVSFAYSKDTDPKIISQGAKLMEEAGQEVLINDFLACDRFDSTDRLSQLRLPSLIISGTNDKLTPLELSHELHELIPSSKLRSVPKAAHMPMVENPLVFNQILAQDVTW